MANNEINEFVANMRSEWKISFPDDPTKKKEYINKWSRKTWIELECESLAQISQKNILSDLQSFIDQLGEEEEQKSLRRKIYIFNAMKRELAKGLTKYILTDNWVVSPEITEFIAEIPVESSNLLGDMVATFSDTKGLTEALKKSFKAKDIKANKVKTGLKKTVKTTKYDSFFDQGYTDAGVAEIEISQKTKKLGIKRNSMKYVEMKNKEKQKVKKARRLYKRRKQKKKEIKEQLEV